MIWLHALFWVSLLLIFHAYAGYPLWMLLLARVRRQPVRRGTQLRSVTAIVSVHNAEAMIERRLENLRALDYPAHLLEIIVVCDGCTDATETLLVRQASKGLRILVFPQRRGKAAGLADAAAIASGEILLMVDVRQRIEADALRRLVANFADADVGAVSGELCFEDAERGFQANVGAYWRYEKRLRQAEAGSGSVIGVTGALYAIRRDLYVPLPGGTVLDDVLTPMNVARDGYRVVFEAGAVAWDRPSATSMDERGRKVRTLAGNYQLIALAPWLLVPFRNPLWFRFVSHKLLRLLVPWLLCLLAASTAVLAFSYPFYLLCLAGGLVVMGLLLLGAWIPVLSEWMPIRLLSTFWHMNIYAGQALLAYLRNPRLHLW